MTTAHQRAKDAHWGLPVPPGCKHGQGTWAAKVYGCDCKKCLPTGRRLRPRGQRIPHAERQQKLRESKHGQPVPPSVKHGIYAYKIYGCRCDPCVLASNARRRRRTWAWLKNATGHYAFAAKKDADNFDVDVIHWPPAGTGIWTCPDCGIQLRHRPATQRQEAA